MYVGGSELQEYMNDTPLYLPTLVRGVLPQVVIYWTRQKPPAGLDCCLVYAVVAPWQLTFASVQRYQRYTYLVRHSVVLSLPFCNACLDEDRANSKHELAPNSKRTERICSIMVWSR